MTVSYAFPGRDIVHGNVKFGDFKIICTCVTSTGLEIINLLSW